MNVYLRAAERVMLQDFTDAYFCYSNCPDIAVEVEQAIEKSYYEETAESKLTQDLFQCAANKWTIDECILALCFMSAIDTEAK